MTHCKWGVMGYFLRFRNWDMSVTMLWAGQGIGGRGDGIVVLSCQGQEIFSFYTQCPDWLWK